MVRRIFANSLALRTMGQYSGAAKDPAPLANGTPLFAVGQCLRLVVLALLACTVSCARVQGGGPALPAHQEPIHFSSDGFTLAGTLYLPAGVGPYPAVVLFHGSGPQTRYEFEGHWFAEHGVAALTYDKRGVGESTGDFRSVPFMTLCDDGLAAIQLLKARRDIDPHRIGVWGLSQGGWLGPLAASRSSDVAFVIAVSGPGVSPGEQMLYFWASDLRDQGVPDRQVEEATAVRREVWNYMETGNGYERAKADLEHARTAPWYRQVKQQRDDLFSTLEIPEQLRRSSHRWFQQEAVYDPTVALRKLRVPSLFLFGEDDHTIPVADSVRIIRETLTQSGSRDFTIREFPKTDHAMFVRDAGGGRVRSDDYVKSMSDWLTAHHFSSAGR